MVTITRVRYISSRRAEIRPDNFGFQMPLGIINELMLQKLQKGSIFQADLRNLLKLLHWAEAE